MRLCNLPARRSIHGSQIAKTTRLRGLATTTALGVALVDPAPSWSAAPRADDVRAAVASWPRRRSGGPAPNPHLRGRARRTGSPARRAVVPMHRDERRDRAPARPPRRWRGADGGFTAPVDGDAGGTWISAKDSGVVLALLNHEAPTTPQSSAAGAGRRIGRGVLVTTLAAKRRRPMRPASAPRGSPRMRRSGCS